MKIWKVNGVSCISQIEWESDLDLALSIRFPMKDLSIATGTELLVRPNQVAIFCKDGRVADIFGPGRYRLDPSRLPVLRNMDAGLSKLQRPFQADIYFVSTAEIIDQKWGTPSPLVFRDKELGPLRVRAHGTYSYRIDDPSVFFRKLVGHKEVYLSTEIEGQLRSLIVAGFMSFLSKSKVPFIDMAANQLSLSAELRHPLSVAFRQYGLNLETFLIQGISLPPELQKYFDKAVSMKLSGNLKKFALFQAADSLEEAAKHGGEGLSDVIQATLDATQETSSPFSTDESTEWETAGQTDRDLPLGEGIPVVWEETPSHLRAALNVLKELLAKGVLTEEEFERKKRTLLKR